MQSFTSKSGQMLLVVILVMVVSLTIGLSVASRSITNLKISKENEESQRAFQAAESGIEIARKIAEKELKTGTTDIIEQGPKNLSNNSRYSVDKEPISSADALNDDKPVVQDKGIDIWLIPYDQFISGSVSSYHNFPVTIAWQTDSPGCSGANASPAIEVFTLETSLTSPTITKRIYDDVTSCGTRVQGSSGITNVNGSSTTKTLPDGSFVTYRYSASIPVSNGIVMKVVPLFNSTRMYVEGTNLPTQGYLLTSTGSSGETVRKLEYFESNPELPIEMFYSILSQ